ncbi:MAG TPA: Ig-like domain-containing protein [Candidatus Binatia bacterium]|nr:Ig-like domain-containing protein [Candidatus Binatia bacterium]
MRGTPRRGWLAVGVLGLLAAACSSTGPPPPATHADTPVAGVTGGLSTPTPTPVPTPSGPPSLTVTPADGSSGVGLDQPITVTAANAQIGSVNVQEDGASLALAADLTSDGREWQYQGGLDLDATYTVTATAKASGDAAVRATTTFSTITSAHRLLTDVGPGNGVTVGIGEPIDLHFNTPIPAADRSDIVAHIAVVSNPPQAGGWYWFDSQDLHYRPAAFWEPGTVVTVVGDLQGVDAGNGYWGLGDWNETFTIGPSHITIVDTQSRQMWVYDDHALLYNWPVNTGKTGFDTIDGTLVVLFHTPVIDMKSCPTFHTPDACTPGGANYYDENVYQDTAVSSDGYYIHSAPWACNDSNCNLQTYGRAVNSSHGCINLAPDHATAYYSWSQVGDVVEVEGSPLQASYSDGEGDWQVPWSEFVQGGQDVPASAIPSPSPTPTAGATPAATPSPSATPTPAPARP